MSRIVDGARGTRAPLRHTARTGAAGLRWYAQAEAAARAGERARWHRAEPRDAYAAGADARPGAGIDEYQPRETQA
ncbi:hypothetical protein [Streptomyces sp. T028]|uniref:hypothetical protein n=1 Tax=Streptomyces sp. T028 TaxID=3394379 RepID=UPI003A83926C